MSLYRFRNGFIIGIILSSLFTYGYLTAPVNNYYIYDDTYLYWENSNVGIIEITINSREYNGRTLYISAYSEYDLDKIICIEPSYVSIINNIGTFTLTSYQEDSILIFVDYKDELVGVWRIIIIDPDRNPNL